MPYQEVSSASWSDFKSVALPNLFIPISAKRGRYYFRGVGSSSWQLMSSFDRWYQSLTTPNKPTRVIAAKRLLDLFKEEASRLSPEPTLSNDPDQLTALAQHYGVPTRLLDWTESPYVAAFFAFAAIPAAAGDSGDVAIWGLDTESPIWGDDNGIKKLSSPSPYNERLKNQLGKFTLLTSTHSSVEEHINHCATGANTLWKFTLPKSEAQIALSDLDFMGINYSTIYPGLDGCTRAASLRMLIEQ